MMQVRRNWKRLNSIQGELVCDTIQEEMEKPFTIRRLGSIG